ncbi:hypothetical protein [Alteromonas naphthalenivorans]|uniref:hypothetical protein n=1 Tax=Alteromonas naphthalenivorans TaxID=715451 RepID=UPI001872697B|nr:hypothetical protein [Alteromonas naphthalenivorans]
MEIAIDPTQMWHNFVQFVLDYKLLASLFLVVLLHFFKKGTLRLIKRRSSRKGEDRRNQINILEQLGPVDLCCIYFTQQYMGSHIIENASDTMLA